MLTYRRKEGSGKIHLMERKGGSKSRTGSHKILVPGSTMEVDKESDLPGYPYSMDGWEFIGSVKKPADSGPERSTAPGSRKRSSAQPVEGGDGSA